MKKTLLIICIFTITLCSAGEFWNQTRYSLYKTTGHELLGFENNHIAEFYGNKLSAQFDFNTFISEDDFDLNLSPRNSYTRYELNSLIGYKFNSNHNLYFGFNNRFFDSAKTGSSVINGINLPAIPTMKSYALLSTDNSFGKTNVVAGIRFRRQYIKPTIFIPTFIEPDEIEHYDEFYKDLTLSYQFNEKITAYTKLYDKTFTSSKTTLLDEDESDYDLTNYGFGIRYKESPFYVGKFIEDFYYERRDGETVNSETENYFINNFRYLVNVTPNLSAFCTYISRFSYDTEQEEFLRIANLVRLQLRYSLPCDIDQAYVIAGTRINAENQLRRYFVDIKYPIYDKLYIKVADSYNYESHNDFVTAIEYYISRVSNIYIENIYTDSLEDSHPSRYVNNLTFGTRIYF
ncbi:MAG: hypothetical protein B6226_02500 [Candidatus Cloacimonetes bacterium 4572_65]|nr:MAG: hypothetical protein B6226_02500 [Candidatus Cloacimonetes bacterium 4572_65]